MHVKRLVFVASFGLLLAGCASDEVAPPALPSTPLERVEARVAFVNVTDASSPSYPEAALGSNPQPSSPGLWLGYDVTPNNCFRDLKPGGWPARDDKDEDWMYDDCEFKIASAFRPFLFSDGYCMGGEPYYAVKQFYYPPQGIRYVRIIYMLSYYDDCGYVVDGEPHSGPGDGETIQFNVAFDAPTQHWLFHSMSISEHGNLYYYDWQDTQVAFIPRVTYGGVPAFNGFGAGFRGYPNVWVSHGKHGNFVDEDQCEAIIGSISPDRCVSSGGGRVFIGADRNVGEVRWDGTKSPMNPANPDGCYPSVDGRGNGKEECYLKNQPFNGWYPGIPSGGSYYNDLRDIYAKFYNEVGFGPGNPPPIVGIEGPGAISPYQSTTWWAYANAPWPYSLQWYVDGSPAETGESITRSWGPNESHQLQLVINAYASPSNSSVLTVQTYNSCAGGNGCEEQFNIQGRTGVPISTRSSRPGKTTVTTKPPVPGVRILPKQ